LALMVAVLLTAPPVWSQETSNPAEAPEVADAHDVDLPVSLERIRRALAVEPRLSVAWPREPTFRIRVDRHVPLKLDDIRPDDSPKPPPTTTGIDLLSLVKGVFSGARRDREQREARQTVDEALRNYCAAQPEGGAGILVCSTVRTP
jgi:hypothetical protein